MIGTDEHIQEPINFEERVALQQSWAARLRAISSDEREKRLELLQAMPREERQKRLEALEAELPKVPTGYGIDEKLRPISAYEAQTDREFEAALERMSILVLNDREQAEDRSLHQDVLQSIHSDFRAAVSWARRTFHAHGFPSSCYVRYSGEKKAWTVVSGVQYRQSDDHGPQGIMPISHVIGAEYLPGSEEGSQLYFSNYILSLFREVMNLRSSIALLKQNMKLVEELLEQLRLAVSRGDSRKVLSLADGLSESKLHTASGEWHVLHLMDHLHRMLAAHKQALIRAEIEPDALWRREMARAARSHGKMATRTNTGKANERQAAFHKHLDNCRKSERWMLMSDPRKVSKAKASFDKMLEGDEELKTLFRPVKRLAWYESSFAEWRKQRIENVVDS